MDKPENIARIFYKFHCKEPLTSEEQGVLFAWRHKSDEHEAMFQKLMDENFVLEDFLEFLTLDKAGSWAKIASATGFAAEEFVTQPDGNIVLLKKSYWKRWMAAAVLIGIIGAGGWLWVTRHPGQSTGNATQQVVNDISPAGKKAILTLANGARITLDSVGIGMIAHQGNVLVSKTANSGLSYKPVNLSHNEVLYNSLATPRAGQFQLTLPDGTKVWLNNASILHYPVLFTDSIREVELTGEAYFEVAKDPIKPFKVKVRQMTVEVLGTSFNISSYSDEPDIKTTLVTGGVQVSQEGKQRTLRPGEQAQLSITGELRIVKDVDLDAILAWRDGFFTFYKADTRAVMIKLARWYDFEVRYEGEPPPRLMMGYIRHDNTFSDILQILRKNDFHLKVEGRTVTVLP